MNFLLKLLFIIVVSVGSIEANDGFDGEYDLQEYSSVDPLKPYNQAMTYINDKIYTHALTPIAKGYENILAEDIRSGILNAFNNLLFPINFINNLLQLKVANSMDEVVRFLINTTLGFGGLKDVARDNFAIMSHKEDFGQTLGHYGVGDDIYIVLPILGPSNLRDIVGGGVDFYTDPLSYVNYSVYYRGYRGFNNYSYDYKLYDEVKKDSIDIYPMLKSIYEQNRKQKILE